MASLGVMRVAIIKDASAGGFVFVRVTSGADTGYPEDSDGKGQTTAAAVSVLPALDGLQRGAPAASAKSGAADYSSV